MCSYSSRATLAVAVCSVLCLQSAVLADNSSKSQKNLAPLQRRSDSPRKIPNRGLSAAQQDRISSILKQPAPGSILYEKSRYRDKSGKSLHQAAPVKKVHAKLAEKLGIGPRSTGTILGWSGSAQGGGAGNGLVGTPCADCQVGELTCNADPVAGDLVETCVLDDGAFVQSFPFTVDVSGTVEVLLTSEAFDTFLIIADSSGDCAVVAGNDDCVPGDFDNSCVSVALAAGEYYALVTSFDAAETGPFTLSVTCTEGSACDRCEQGVISCGEAVSGSLVAEDCTVTGSDLSDLYAFDVDETGRFSLTLTSKGFDTLVRVLDAGCQELGTNDDCTIGDTSTSCLTIDLEAGSYVVEVTSFGGDEVGDYSLDVQCDTIGDPCGDCVIGDVVCDVPVEGVLGESGCSRENGASLDTIAFSVETLANVTIDLTSADFDTFVTLSNAACEVIAENDDCDFGNTNSCLTIELEPGDYFVGASSYDSTGEGDYDLVVSCASTVFCQDCSVGELPCSGLVQGGDLAEGDCTLEDGTFADVWQLEVADGQNLALELISADFDTVITLLDANCEVVASNDDCDDTTDSCLVFRQLAGGSYSVVATSFEVATGAYELTATCTTFDLCRDCLDGTLDCGGSVSGELSADDCEFGDATNLDTFSFTLDSAQEVTLDLTSLDFDAYLLLGDGVCANIGENDDCTDLGTDACIVAELPAGEYFAIANSFSPAAGSYDLSLTCADIMTCTDCNVGGISCNSTVDGTLGESLCTLPDETNIDYYSFSLPTDATVTIELNSPDFDTFLLFFGSDCLATAGNDDCEPGSTNSCLTLSLTAGEYSIGVNSFFVDSGAGSYTLTVSSPDCVSGGGRIPGDCSEDGIIDISDGICLLSFLFLGSPVELPCGDGTVTDGGNLQLLDNDQSGTIDLSDGVFLFNYLFLGGQPPALGLSCVAIEGCEEQCTP